MTFTLQKTLYGTMCATLAASALVSAPLFAADAEEGKRLVDENCYACHGTEIYTRADRRVTTRPGLTKQVQRCELALGLQWFDEDVENAAHYLNLEFYHFK
ncbi:MAG: cytochrome c [Chromatiales bacterium]|nr:cytochrome c [Chromatiales bacterium]